jgi:hypothetical protein
MSEHSSRDLGRVFDEVPDLYDRARPGYPTELFTDLITIAGLADDASIIEVGCGTGQAMAFQRSEATHPQLDHAA